MMERYDFYPTDIFRNREIELCVIKQGHHLDVGVDPYVLESVYVDLINPKQETDITAALSAIIISEIENVDWNVRALIYYDTLPINDTYCVPERGPGDIIQRDYAFNAPLYLVRGSPTRGMILTYKNESGFAHVISPYLKKNHCYSIYFSPLEQIRRFYGRCTRRFSL